MIKDSQNNTMYVRDELTLKEILLGVREWWKYLISNWLIIILFGMIGCLLGFYYAYNKKVLYVATTTFVLEDTQGAGGSLGSLAGLASMAGVDVNAGGSIFQGDNIMELYKSRNIIISTLLGKSDNPNKKSYLIDQYIAFNDLKQKWAKRPDLLKIRFRMDGLRGKDSIMTPSRIRDSVLSEIYVDIVKNYLVVSKPDKKLSIINVVIKSPDEQFSKSFNDAIVTNVNDYYLHTKTKKSLENVRIMQQKADSVRSVMNGAIYRAVEVADATPNLNITRQVQRVAPAQKAQFSAETNKAILSSLVQNLEMSKLSLMKETPLLEIVDQPVFPLPKDRFGKLKWLIIGGFAFALVTIICIVFHRIFKRLMS